jgi:U3 small nucleolar RNA-associated protein MPP10
LEDADEDDDFGSDRDIGSNKKKKNKKQVDEDDEFNQFNDDNDDMSFDEDMGEPEDNENAVFNLAKENNEMHDPNSLNTKKPATSYTNQEMVSKIEKLEDQMVSGKDPVSKKGWQLQGEATSHSRPLNSLLAEHLDFNTASKLPPTITQEKSTSIEAVIKQRIMDELFDDPVRKYLPGGKKGQDDDGFDFTKSKKGLGELYEDEYRKKLLKNDPNAYLLTSNDLTGADAKAKQEIQQLMKGLFYQLDQLSNMHFTPRPPMNDT